MTAIRCADWAAAEGVALTGTAPVVAGVLLIEWTTPWPRDVADIVELAEVVEVARSTRIRVQVVRRTTPGPERVIALYRRDSEMPFDGFRRVEGVAGADTIVATALDLLGRPLSAAAPSPDVVDVLVCAHGTRDVCCGSRGTRLSQEVGEMMAQAGFRVWRTSHLGGHRFAPTALILPFGTLWGHLDPSTLTSIVRRELEPARAAPHLRGSVALAPPLQVVERAAFESTGWGWFDRPRHGTVDGSTATLVSPEPGGDGTTWTGTVTTRRVVAVPECGRAPVDGDKMEAELELISVHRTS